MRTAALIELDTIAPFAHLALSEPERLRFAPMGDRRRRSYLGARLACKRLFRELNHNDSRTPAADITTVDQDPRRPCIPVTHAMEAEMDPAASGRAGGNRLHTRIAAPPIRAVDDKKVRIVYRRSCVKNDNLVKNKTKNFKNVKINRSFSFCKYKN